MNTKNRILFLAAAPTDAVRLRLDEELREIEDQLRLSVNRDEFELYQKMALRPKDVTLALLDHRPRVVHFSGHGDHTGAIYLETESGTSHPVAPRILSELFREFSGDIECVILNACFSEIQAKAIAQHIKYVIGMNDAINDTAAIAFAVGFYQALGAQETIERAFRLGRIQAGLKEGDQLAIPILISKDS